MAALPDFFGAAGGAFADVFAHLLGLGQRFVDFGVFVLEMLFEFLGFFFIFGGLFLLGAGKIGGGFVVVFVVVFLVIISPSGVVLLEGGGVVLCLLADSWHVAPLLLRIEALNGLGFLGGLRLCEFGSGSWFLLDKSGGRSASISRQNFFAC